MIKKVIFIDWDGTLSTSRFWESTKKNDSNFTKIVDDFFTFEMETMNKWMKGLFNSEYINKIISDRSGIPEDQLWQSFVSDCQNMKTYPDTIELIQKIRLNCPVILVTGNMDCFTRFTVPALKLNEKFDLIINSSDIGYLKTENNGKIFFDCLKIYNRESLSESYLIDDSIKTCDLFSSLGGNVLRVNEIKDTIEYLKMILVNDISK
jgi:FMN phosphatase YigB (HAD superfamily)